MSADVTALLNELEAAVKQFAAMYESPRVPPGRYRPPHEFLGRLTAALSESADFALDPKQMVSTWSATGPLSASTLASALIERVADGASASEATADLSKLLARKSSDIYVLMAITGVKLQNIIEFERGVTAMPAAEVPATLAREAMFDLDRTGKNIFRGTVLTMRAPCTALIINGHMTVLHNSERDWSKHKALTEDIVAKRERALASLTLSGSASAPYITAETSWIDHPAFPYSGFGFTGFGIHHGVSPSKLGDVTEALAKDLYEKCSRLPKLDRTILLRAAERLSRSRSHPSEVDQAIDLGIATEMIFLHELNDHTELRFRIALRAAWLLGANGEERNAIFQCLKKAYDARSVAVHTGKLTDQSQINNLALADKYCADGMRRILSAGRFPAKWDDVILSVS